MLLLAQSERPRLQEWPATSILSAGQPIGPGRMQLLPGYVVSKPICFDTDCGRIISSPPGLTINYDIGLGMVRGAFTVKERRKFKWFRDETTHQQRVQYGLRKEGPSQRLEILFPDAGAFFWADVKNDAEAQTVVTMVLTYKGPT